MATNVTEKDKTLNEIIEWCEQLEVEGLRLANALLMQHEMAAYGVVKGQNRRIRKDSRPLPFHARLFRHHAHGGTQSKRGCEMNSVLDLFPRNVGVRVKLDTGETYFLESGWDFRADGICGMAYAYEDDSDGYCKWSDSALIAIMTSHIKLMVPCNNQSEDAE